MLTIYPVSLCKDDCTAAQDMAGQSPRVTAKPIVVSTKIPTVLNRFLDLAHVYSAVTFYLPYWHNWSLFRQFFTRFIFCLLNQKQSRALAPCEFKSDLWSSNCSCTPFSPTAAHGDSHVPAITTAEAGQQNNFSIYLHSLCCFTKAAVGPYLSLHWWGLWQYVSRGTWQSSYAARHGWCHELGV